MESRSVGRLPKPIEKPRRGTVFDPQVFLSTVGAAKSITQCPKGYKIFSQGATADAVFYIQKGRVKLTVASKKGKEAVVGILGAGDFFGEGCMEVQPVRMATATAIAPSTILRIEKQEMMRVLHEERALSDFLISYLLCRNCRIQEDLVDQLFYSSEKRLARALLLLAHYPKEGKPESVLPDIDQGMLAEMIGTTRSRVSLFMNKFKKLGFIDYNGELRVHSSLLDGVLHD